MNESELLDAWAEDVVSLDARVAALEAELARERLRVSELEARVADLAGERSIYHEMVQVALVMVRRLTEIIRTQRRAANGWTRDHEATVSEELLAIDAWIDTQLRHSDRSEAA